MRSDRWKQCLEHLEGELSSQQFNTWIRPLHAVEDGETLRLLAPNQFVKDWVDGHLLERITGVLERGEERKGGTLRPKVVVQVGSRPSAGVDKSVAQETQRLHRQGTRSVSRSGTGLRRDFTFENFVEGKSNQLARAASIQVAGNPGRAYNPLFIYGGVGLGKTHIMHAIGNLVVERKPRARVVYLHSERFVGDMVKALQHNAINDFKRFYRSVETLLIDDIQFFAGKERSQEEFFHTFNALFEDDQQIVMTCDRYAKEVDGLEERLKSRFGWGLTVAIEPPDTETCVAILQSKAELAGVTLPNEVAFFVAQRIHSNVRELEGALRRIVASSRFTGMPISLPMTKEALKDVLALQDKLVSIENIQKTVAQYFKIRVTDMVSKRRTRSVARPRQIAMALAKELTSHSLPEIGESFGGRDHTTVLHACRKVAELRGNDPYVKEDYMNLLRTLSN